MKMDSLNNPAFFKSWQKIFHPDKELSPRLAHKSKIINDYLNDQNKLFLELRENILKKYGTKDDKGELVVKEGNIEFKPETIKDVNKDFAELMQIDLEPAPPSKIKVEELEKDGIKLSGPDTILLGDLLDFGDEAKPTLALVPPSN